MFRRKRRCCKKDEGNGEGSNDGNNGNNGEGGSYIPILPIEPTDPTVPVTPITPTDPTNPNVPITPITPVTPTNPTVPVTPITPITPITPVTPTNPTIPITPTVPPNNPSTPTYPSHTNRPYIPKQPQQPGSSTDSPLIFNWDSDYRNNHMYMYQNHTQRQLQILDNTFNGRDAPILRDSQGRRIVNMTEEKLWFKDYVALIFSVGCIFNSNDRERLNEILRAFENDEEIGFLMNFKKVASYNDKLIKAIEERMEIGNGNYHVCLITIVTTNDSNILSRAPEAQYRVSGVINKYCEWNEIQDYITQITAKYGLVTEQRMSHDDKLSWEMGVEGLVVKTSPKNEVESSFDIDIDPENENQIRLDTELEFMREREEHFNTRQRNTKMMRDYKDGSYNPHRNRFTKNGSLYTRIYRDDTCGITDDSVHDSHLGVQLRMHESIVPPDKARIEYQLYNDPNSYQDGKNVVVDTDSNTREQIQRFQQTSIRGAKSRIVTDDPVRAIKSMGGRIPRG